MAFPFEVPADELSGDLDGFVDAVMSSLESAFMVMPKGDGFVDYETFASGYEALKMVSRGFEDLSVERIVQVVGETPISFVVLRTMLGFTPPELAYVTTTETDVEVAQGYARSIDRKIRLNPTRPLSTLSERFEAMIRTACILLERGASDVARTSLHRLDKADTKRGQVSIEAVAKLGVPYSVLLYERFLGRPFAGHRDSVSEIVGDMMETPIEDVLTSYGVSFRKTGRAERVEGFEQAPDFIIPDEFSPKVVIEAKITEDDGTARDKVTRIQHLHTLSLQGAPNGRPRYSVVACIDGRGFAVRREDMKKIIRATGGRVFTLKTLARLVECSDIGEFATQRPTTE